MHGVLRPARSIVMLSIALIAATLVSGVPAGAAVCLDTPAGQLARWPGDGSTAEVAHGRDGNLVGGTTYAAGKVGQAFSFDGVDDKVTVPDDPDWTIDRDFTIATWVRIDGTSPFSQAFIAHDESVGSVPKWVFWRRDDGKLGFTYGDGASGVDAVMFPWSPALGEWHHVAVTRAGTTFTLYVDGAAVASDSASQPIVDVVGPLTLGWGETNWFLNGALDEPELYQRALSATEMQGIADAGSAGTARCAITRSTLDLTGPATAYPGETVTLDGTLALSGGASAAAKTVTISRTIDDGAPVTLPAATTAADGSFSLQDAPGDGIVVYRATYAGATNVSAENDFVTVVVGKQESTISVALSRSRVKLGAKVTIVAHLDGGTTNRTVTIWAVPNGSSKRQLARGKVGADGDLSVADGPTRRTEYYATYAGDAAWEKDTSTSKTVGVVPRWTIKIQGGYATVGGVRLYHYSSKCDPGNDIGCPFATFTLSPNHAGKRVYFVGRYCKNGRCVDDSGTYRLNEKSKVSVYIYYGDSSVIGWTINFRYRFPGDGDHLASTSGWVKTRITA